MSGDPRWWAAGLLAAIVGVGLVRQFVPLPTTPAPVPAATAAAWMVDALPGIGEKRLPTALVAVNGGRFADLPKAARQPAAEAFIVPSVPR